MTLLRHIIFRIAAVIAALALLASCHEEQQPETAAQTLSVDAFAAHRTKGYVVGTTLYDTPYDKLHSEQRVRLSPRDIHLTAWLKPQSGPEQEYFRDEEYTRHDDGLWHHDPAMYWPMAGHLDFLAYSSTIPFEDITWHGGKSTDAMTLSVDRRFTQDDILFSFVRDQVSGNADGAVPMVFDHAQAWLQFNLRATVPDIVTVREIVIKDVYTAGDLVIDHPFATAEASWSFRREIRRDTPVDDTPGLYGSILSTSTRSLDWLLPEQPQTSIVIAYSLAGSAMVIEHEYPLTPGATWLMGRKYVYDITISPSQITIAPSVVDWDEVLLDGADDAVWMTAAAVDSVGGAFTFAAASAYWWRPDGGSDYARLSGGEGTWGTSASFVSGDTVVTFSGSDPNYLVTLSSLDDRRDYFTTTAEEAGAVSFSGANAVEYSLNGGAWAPYSASIAVSAGDVIRWRGDNASYDSQPFSSTAAFSVGGNVMSLISSDAFEEVSSLGDRALFGLFRGATTLTDASALRLPATTVGAAAYSYMFYGCSSLTAAPRDLPAVTLGRDAYYAMFFDCAAMEAGPQRLAATSYPAAACRAMFYRCRVLEAAPAFTVAAVADSALINMFNGCYALSDATGVNIETDTPSVSSYQFMFANTNSLAKAPRLYVAVAPDRCCSQMFYKAIALADASDVHLDAHVVGEAAYQSMFNRCALLTAPPTMSSMTLGVKSCMYMFIHCSALPVAPNMRVVGTADACCQQMFENAVALADISRVKLPAEASPNCYRSMFSNCPLLTEAPDLPSPTAPDHCYATMFNLSSGIASVRMLATDVDPTALGMWLGSVAPTGTFYKSAAAEWDVTGPNGVPEGWTVVYE